MLCKAVCNKMGLSNNFVSKFELGTSLINLKYISNCALVALQILVKNFNQSVYLP
jgi:hypothetical protein